MDPERLSVVLRPRIDWEAIDLGLALVRRHAGAVYRPWLLLTVPAAALACLSLPVVGVLAFWWLLPLGDAVVLFTVSRAVFGDPPSTREALAALRGFLARLAPEILWRRIFPGRAERMPIGILEGVRGRAYRERAALLAGDGSFLSPSLAALFLAFELCLVLAIGALAGTMIAEGTLVDAAAMEVFFDGDAPTWVYRAAQLVVAGAWIALRPFHVGAAFALYLNRRIGLEGWDVEIAFRRLARRIATMSVRAAVIAVIAMAAWPTSLSAWVEPVEVAPPRDPAEVARKVLERPELSHTEVRTVWRPREEQRKATPEGLVASSPLALRLFAALVANVGEVLLWAAFVLAVLAGAVRWRRWLGRRRSLAPPRPENQPARARAARELRLELSSKPLPPDPARAAAALWARGELLLALGLLYRAAIARLIAYGAALPEGFTEDDCLREARRRLDADRADAFAALTRVWQQAAYGHRLPEPERGGELISAWRRAFGLMG